MIPTAYATTVISGGYKFCVWTLTAQSVGFYYMSNAMGRLVGTLASGAIYTYAGDDAHHRFAACFWASSGFSFLAGAIALFIRDDRDGLACGPCVCVGAMPREEAIQDNEMEKENEAEGDKEAGKVEVQVVAKHGERASASSVVRVANRACLGKGCFLPCIVYGNDGLVYPIQVHGAHTVLYSARLICERCVLFDVV